MLTITQKIRCTRPGPGLDTLLRGPMGEANVSHIYVYCEPAGVCVHVRGHRGLMKVLKTRHFCPRPIDLRDCHHFLDLEAEFEDSYTKIRWYKGGRARIRYPTARPNGGGKCMVNLHTECTCECMYICTYT